MINEKERLEGETCCEVDVIHDSAGGDRKLISRVIIFMPLLAVYVFIVLAAYSNTFQGDEGRYVIFATNLSKGYYSPLGTTYLWNGPGYPIILLPFVLLKLPWLAAKLLNPLFLFAAVIYFYYTLRFYMKERKALMFSYLLGMYPPFCRFIHMLLTEQFAVFLVCGFLFHYCSVHVKKTRPGLHILLASFYLGFFALTKIFVGYVIACGLLLWLCIFLFKRRHVIQTTILIYVLALLMCVPYLIYTYSLTGKMFYWGNSGGHALYLMSTDYKDGYGDWNLLRKYRKEMYEGIGITTETEIDDVVDGVLKKRALRNIVDHPSAYFKNWLANIGRLWFNFPFSFESQKLGTFFYMIPNMFLFVILLLSIYPAYLRRAVIPFEMYATIVFGLIYLTGSSFLFILNRQIWPMVPVLFLCISFVLSRFVRIDASVRLSKLGTE